MATVVKGNIEWHNARSFPWDKWTDGRIWRLKKGTDFTGDIQRMRTRLWNQAGQRNMRVRTKKESDTSIVFQFYKGK